MKIRGLVCVVIVKLDVIKTTYYIKVEVCRESWPKIGNRIGRRKRRRSPEVDRKEEQTRWMACSEEKGEEKREEMR